MRKASLLASQSVQLEFSFFSPINDDADEAGKLKALHFHKCLRNTKECAHFSSLESSPVCRCR